MFGMGVLCALPAQAAEYVVDQQNKTFVMNGKQVEKMSINQGDVIRFKNADTFFHNIFSLSETATFDVGSFPKGDSRTVKFEKKGKVDIECAIHPDMYLEVDVK
ncbi:MAG: methylamine utilization protein [Pseudomonadota bacterium]